MSSRFIHVDVRTSFLRLNNISLHECTTSYLSVSSLMDTGCCDILTFESNTGKNRGVQLPLPDTAVSPLGCLPKVELLSQMVIPHKFFEESPYCFIFLFLNWRAYTLRNPQFKKAHVPQRSFLFFISITTTPFSIPTNSAQGLQFPHILANTQFSVSLTVAVLRDSSGWFGFITDSGYCLRHYSLEPQLSPAPLPCPFTCPAPVPAPPPHLLRPCHPSPAPQLHLPLTCHFTHPGPSLVRPQPLTCPAPSSATPPHLPRPPPAPPLTSPAPSLAEERVPAGGGGRGAGLAAAGPAILAHPAALPLPQRGRGRRLADPRVLPQPGSGGRPVARAGLGRVRGLLFAHYGLRPRRGHVGTATP